MFLSIFFGLIGGLGLFLYGMKIMSTGLQKAAGNKLKRILELLTTNPIMATITGIIVTVLVQSSSTTHVMVVGFTNSGLMSLSQAIGTMLGANVGTTITAQMISFDIFIIVYPLIGVGAAVHLFSGKRVQKALGQALIGFGILFLGLFIMSDAIYPLRSFEPFLEMLATFGTTPILGILVGALFTAMVQSSSATTGVVIALTLQGAIDTPSAVSIVLGANIGTSITAAIASIGTNLTAKRAVLSIIFVKVFGVLIALVLFRPFVQLIYFTGDSVTRQVANAHTIFNVANVLLALPFIKPITSVITKVLPGEAPSYEQHTTHLDERLIKTPPVAIEAARNEVLRMSIEARTMLSDAVHTFINSDKQKIDQIYQKEAMIDDLEKQITEFLTQISRKSLSDDQSYEVSAMMHMCSDIERIGDHAENILQLAEVKIEDKIQFSQDAENELINFYKQVDKMLEMSIQAYTDKNKRMAQEVIDNDINVNFMERELRKRHISRLNKNLCQPISGVVFLDFISNLERVADHSTNLAEVVTGDF